jgi:hypothetical protein
MKDLLKQSQVNLPSIRRSLRNTMFVLKIPMFIKGTFLGTSSKPVTARVITD